MFGSSVTINRIWALHLPLIIVQNAKNYHVHLCLTRVFSFCHIQLLEYPRLTSAAIICWFYQYIPSCLLVAVKITKPHKKLSFRQVRNFGGAFKHFLSNFSLHSKVMVVWCYHSFDVEQIITNCQSVLLFFPIGGLSCSNMQTVSDREELKCKIYKRLQTVQDRIAQIHGQNWFVLRQ